MLVNRTALTRPRLTVWRSRARFISRFGLWSVCVWAPLRDCYFDVVVGLSTKSNRTFPSIPTALPIPLDLKVRASMILPSISICITHPLSPMRGQRWRFRGCLMRDSTEGFYRRSRPNDQVPHGRHHNVFLYSAIDVVTNCGLTRMYSASTRMRAMQRGDHGNASEPCGDQ